MIDRGSIVPAGVMMLVGRWARMKKEEKKSDVVRQGGFGGVRIYARKERNTEPLSTGRHCQRF
jgi:hypothetical protein